MTGCGLFISGSLEKMSSQNIDTSNLVNKKLLYYYTHKTSLKSADFTNAGQIILVNCSDSLIFKLEITNISNGISQI